MKKTLIVQAPAKINLALWVKEKRPDGYHEIASLMQSITLADTITLHEIREEGIAIECNHPGVPTNRENLVYKAANVVLDHFGIPPSLSIRIEKRIPVAAGLAGGSSDAAAVMFGLIRMYDQAMPLPDLMNLSQQVGSDVPFVLHGGLALATGRGENLAFVDSPKPPFYVIIAVPKKVTVSTKWAYDHYKPGNNDQKAIHFEGLMAAFKRRDLETLREHAFNDLESVSLPSHPEIGKIKQALTASGKGLVLMSGSGPSVFGLFDDRKAAVQAASALNQDEVDVYMEHTLRSAGR